MQAKHEPLWASLEEKFKTFQDKIFACETALPKPTKHLIAVVVATLAGAEAVKAEHAAEARRGGATDAEIAEALAVIWGQAGGTQVFWIKEDYEELLGRQWRSNLIPEADRSFWDFKRAVFADGALSERTKQLIAVAASSQLRCRHCTVAHIKAAFKAGASKAEVAETLGVLWAVASQAERPRL